jgi:hypothetical protein
MQKSKVILLLQTFSDQELNQLEQFLRSPYFNQKEELVRLFDHIKTFHPDYSDSKLNRTALMKLFFPDQENNKKALGYLLSDLNHLIERFLTLQKLERSPFQADLMLMEELVQRGAIKNYRQIDRTLQKKLETDTTGYSSKHFKAHFEWAENKELHFLNQRLRKFDKNIQKAAYYLDKYYFLQRLNLSCAMLDRQTIFQNNYQIGLSEEWIDHLQDQNFFNEPIIQLYFNIYQALNKEEEDTYFVRLKTFLTEYEQMTAPKDLKDIYLFAINYCARKIRQGKEGYVLEALNLYHLGIEKKILLENGVLSPWTFTNVVKLSLRLHRYTQIETFIQNFAHKLPVDFRENALHYNLAELYYYTKRFDQAQDHLNRVAFSDLNYYLGARVLMAKIYYEREEIEPLLSLIASFTIFLKRNKQLSDNLKSTYLNFCTILFQIIRQSPAQIKKLKDKIDQTDPLTDRTWLQKIYEQTFQ